MFCRRQWKKCCRHHRRCSSFIMFFHYFCIKNFQVFLLLVGLRFFSIIFIIFFFFFSIWFAIKNISFIQFFFIHFLQSLWTFLLLLLPHLMCVCVCEIFIFLFLFFFLKYFAYLWLLLLLYSVHVIWCDVMWFFLSSFSSFSLFPSHELILMWKRSNCSNNNRNNDCYCCCYCYCYYFFFIIKQNKTKKKCCKKRLLQTYIDRDVARSSKIGSWNQFSERKMKANWTNQTDLLRLYRILDFLCNLYTN